MDLSHEKDVSKNTNFFNKALSQVWQKSIDAHQEIDTGISHGSGIIAWAFVKPNKKTSTPVEVLSWGIDTSWEEYNLKRQEYLQKVSEDRMYISSTLDASKTLYRKITIPVTVPAKDRGLALIDTLERTLPPTITLSSSEKDIASPYIFSAWIRKKTDDVICYDAYIASRSDVMFVSSRESDKMAPRVEAIYPKSACLHRWSLEYLSPENPHLIIDISLTETVVLLCVQEEIEYMRCIPSGITSLRILDEDTEPSQTLENNMAIFLESLQECAQVALATLHEKNIPEKALSLVFTGPIVSSHLYINCIQEYLNLSCQKNLRLDHCAVASEVGAALFGTEKNIFSGAYQSPNLIEALGKDTQLFTRHILKPFLYLLAISLFVAFAITLWSIQETRIINEKGVQEWEQFQKDISLYPLFATESKIISNSEKQPQNLEEQEIILTDLQEEIKKRGGYALIPKVATLSETIATIDSIIQAIQKKQPQGDSSKLELQLLKYTMTKRPDIKHPTDSYQVRVDIDFTSPSQAMARSFYDELLLSKTLVDSKSEVKWSATNGRYKTSFYLKADSSPSIYRASGGSSL